MSVPPSGTVTFLFTDIEGSTRLAQQFPAAWPDAKARHDALLESAIAAHGGYVFQVIGDAFCAAFYTAADALAASLNAQRALAGEKPTSARDGQPTGSLPPLRVRMGIHTGAATARPDGDYDGYLTLARVQRIMSAAYGGQVLVSQASAELLGDALRDGVTLRDLGTHRLKDVSAPEHLYQLAAPDLRADYPALSTAEHPNNLPIQPTSFVGREREIGEVQALLARSRLVTLTGVGGAGKTRLSLEAAAPLLPQFSDGIWFIELAPVADPSLLTNTVAALFGVRAEGTRQLRETLLDALRVRHSLLMLDNCEHLLEACAAFADDVLRYCPHVRLLASSREALGIGGEQAYAVRSMTVPPGDASITASEIIRFESARLFAARAVAANADFALTDANASLVAQLCRRLDGIPLAIELAAARVRAMSLEEIASRLDDRFRLLTGGSRTAMPRQQTLRAAMEWSYSLLSEPERALLRRLSVFAGGWTLEAAEAVCSDQTSGASRQTEPIADGTRLTTDVRLLKSADVLDLLTHLVDKSLVVVSAQGMRYRLLETVRQFGAEKLAESGEGVGARDAHKAYYQRWLAGMNPLEGEFKQWLLRLDAELDNLRSVLAWARESHDSAAGVRLHDRSSLFWFVRGYWGEMRNYLLELAARPSELSDPALRVGLGYWIAWYSQVLGDAAAATEWYERTIAQAREIGEPVRMILGQLLSFYGSFKLSHDVAAAKALVTEAVEVIKSVTRDDELLWAPYFASGERAMAWRVGYLLNFKGYVSLRLGAFSAAHDEFTESLMLLNKAGDRWSATHALRNLAEVAYRQGDHAQARAQFEPALARYREFGDQHNIGITLRDLAEVARLQGDLAHAESYLLESLQLWRSVGNRQRTATTLHSLGVVTRERGDVPAALALHRESLALRQQLQNRSSIVAELEAIAETLAAGGNSMRAARLHGSIDTLQRTAGARPAVHAMRQQMGDAAFDAAFQSGQQMTLEQAIAYALEGGDALH